MPLVGLRLNSVTTICLIMAVGVAVDYAAHIAHSFMANQGSREERAVHAVEDMSRSLIAGSVSTFLGVLPLGFAMAETNRIFFKMMVGVIICGVSFGLVLLPILLTELGPLHSAESDFDDARSGEVGERATQEFNSDKRNSNAMLLIRDSYKI